MLVRYGRSPGQTCKDDCKSELVTERFQIRFSAVEKGAVCRLGYFRPDVVLVDQAIQGHTRNAE